MKYIKTILLIILISLLLPLIVKAEDNYKVINWYEIESLNEVPQDDWETIYFLQDYELLLYNWDEETQSDMLYI